MGNPIFSKCRDNCSSYDLVPISQFNGGEVNYPDLLTRVAAGGRAFWFYLGKAVLPHSLTILYPTWAIDPHSPVSYVPWLGFIALFCILAKFRNNWTRPLLLGLAYYFLLLLPVLGFFAMSYQRFLYVTDRWQYFALPAVTVLIALGLYKSKLTYLGLVLAILFSALTFTQCRLYHDVETLCADVLNKNPNSELALSFLGYYRQTAGHPEDAIKLYSRALELNPNETDLHINLGNALLTVGRSDDAIQQYRAAISIDNHHAPPHCSLGSIFEKQGKVNDALAEYRAAIQWQPNYAPAYNALGRLLYLQGNQNEGIAQLSHALAIDPEFPPALINLGVFLTDQNQADQAVSFCQKAVTLYPDDADAHAALGNALFHLKQSSAAQDQFTVALKLNPSQDLALYGQANCLSLSGQNSEAAKLYEQILIQNPDHAESHFRLAMLLVANKQKDPAIAHLRDAVRLKPDWIEAINNLAWFLATDRKSNAADCAKAVRLAERAVELSGGRNAGAFDTLGAAWARNEVFTKAIDAARRAMEVATQTGQSNLATDIQNRIALYNKHSAYSE